MIAAIEDTTEPAPPDPIVERIVADNLDLVDEVILQARAHRDCLADECRSEANWTLFLVARRIAAWGLDPAWERRYLAGAIRLSITRVRCDFGRRRTLVPLVVGGAAGDEPLTRDVAPDAMAEIRELLAMGLPSPAKRAWRGLGAADVARLEALIAADPSPARSNGSIARDFLAATGTRIHSAAVAYYRKRLGLPPSASKGGGHMNRRRTR